MNGARTRTLSVRWRVLGQGRERVDTVTLPPGADESGIPEILAVRHLAGGFASTDLIVMIETTEVEQ